MSDSWVSLLGAAAVVGLLVAILVVVAVPPAAPAGGGAEGKASVKPTPKPNPKPNPKLLGGGGGSTGPATAGLPPPPTCPDGMVGYQPMTTGASATTAGCMPSDRVVLLGSAAAAGTYVAVTGAAPAGCAYSVPPPAGTTVVPGFVDGDLACLAVPTGSIALYTDAIPGFAFAGVGQPAPTGQGWVPVPAGATLGKPYEPGA